MKICRWSCSRYLRNHGFLLCDKFQCLKFRNTELTHKRLFSFFLKCTIVSDTYEHVHIYTIFWKEEAWRSNFFSIFVTNEIFKILLTKRKLIRCYYFINIYNIYIYIIYIKIGPLYWWNLYSSILISSNIIIFYSLLYMVFIYGFYMVMVFFF